MKRGRRLFMASEYRHMALSAYGGHAISPRSLVVAKKENHAEYGSEQWVVQQYSLTFGLRYIFLKKLSADPKDYAIELDQPLFWKSFDVVQDSKNTDYFGLQLPVEEREWESARTGKKEVFTF